MNKLKIIENDNSFKNFLGKQARIYDEFRDLSAVREKGLLPNMPDYLGGYLVCWRHEDNVVAKVKEMSDKVSSRVKSIVYDNQLTTHTTITDLESGPNFVYDEYKMRMLIKTVEEVVDRLNESVIDYREWLMNQDTVIAAGMADYNFYLAGKIISESGKRNGLNLRMPWGSHITTARFLEKKTGEEVGYLIDLIKKSKPIGLSVLRKIEVVLAEHDIGKGLSFKVFKSFDL